MSPTTVPFQWSDAWVLHAVCAARGGKGATLSSVIFAADYIEHAILTTAEVRGGISRLVAAGHVAIGDDTIRPKGAALKLWRELTTKRRAVNTLQRAFEKLLAVGAPPGAPPVDVVPPDQWPTEAMVNEACHAYRDMADAVLSSRNRR